MTNWIDQRARDLAAAIAFLKSRCILLTACNRQSVVREYKVSGKRDRMFDSDVIAYAAWIKRRELRHHAVVEIATAFQSVAQA